MKKFIVLYLVYAHFYPISNLENCSMLSFDIVYRCFWYQFDGHYTKQYFWHHVHLCWGPFLGVFLGLFLCSSISFCSSIFYHEIVYSSLLMATWPKNVLFPSTRGLFWVFLSPCQHVLLYFLKTIQYFLMKLCRYYSDGHYTHQRNN